MKTILMLTLCVAAAGCAAKTPEDRYYAATNALIAVLKPVGEYAADCTPKPALDPCHARVEAVKPKLRSAKKILAETDKVFVTHDSEYYDLSLTTVQNLTKDLAAFVAGGDL